jgi:hypothetical protein
MLSRCESLKLPMSLAGQQQVMGTLALGLLRLSHPTLMVCVGTAGSCQKRP